MIRFDDQVGQWQTGSYDIEGMISVRLQEPDGTLTTMPNGASNELLSDLYKYGQAFLFDTLPGTDHEPHSYKLIFAFSSDAGNDYQNKKTAFDLAVGIDAQPAPANHHHHHHHNNNVEEEIMLLQYLNKRGFLELQSQEKFKEQKLQTMKMLKEEIPSCRSRKHGMF